MKPNKLKPSTPYFMTDQNCHNLVNCCQRQKSAWIFPPGRKRPRTLPNLFPNSQILLIITVCAQRWVPIIIGRAHKQWFCLVSCSLSAFSLSNVQFGRVQFSASVDSGAYFYILESTLQCREMVHCPQRRQLGIIMTDRRHLTFCHLLSLLSSSSSL